MANVFVPLDDVLIERVFQPVTDLTATRLGLGRLVLTCACLDAASLTWLMSRLPELTGDREATMCLQGMLLLLGLTALVSLRSLFRRAGHRPQGNPLRQAMRPHRAVILLLLSARLLQWHGPNLADAADLLMLLFSSVALYLGACAERPPLRRPWPQRAAANAG